MDASHTTGYWAALVLLGLAVGTAGTLIGAGGGFILVPILALMYPGEDPEKIAAVSLAVVMLNAASGSVSYARQKKIDYRSGLIYAAAAMPGAVLGALATSMLPRQAFNLILGVVLIAGSVLLCVTGVRRARGGRLEAPGHADGAVPVEIAAAGARRRVGLGAAISVGVGFVSSLLGIGGGIIHVPAMIMVLGFPVHIATATSHFVLGITAAVGTGVHAANGALDNGWAQTLALGAGVVVGAQVGARLSRRTRPLVIVLGLAIALGLVGVRIAAKAMGV